MSLLFMDSFDHYATADMLDKWTSVVYAVGTIGAYGRNGTNGYRVTAANNSIKIGCGRGNTATGFAGFAMKTNLNSNDSIFAVCAASNSKSDLLVRVHTDGSLHVHRTGGDYYYCESSFSTDIGATAAGVIQVGVWAFLEIQWTIHDTTGAVTIRVNGIEQLALTNVDTKGVASGAGEWGSIVIGTEVGVQHDFDDLYICDTSGSLNNTFLGDVSIRAIFPNGAGNASEWTPSAGSNYDCVNETSPNDDTDYNSAAAINLKDLYAFASAPAGADIRGVQVLAAVRKSAEGPGQVKLVTRSNGTDYDGAAHGIASTEYSYVREVLETDPGSGSPEAAWTESGFNAAEFGVKKTG